VLGPRLTRSPEFPTRRRNASYTRAEGILTFLRSVWTRRTITPKSEVYSHLGRYWLALALLLPLAVARLWGQAPNEKLLSEENAYNPIPSPNGKMIAYVPTGWGRPGGSGGFGRSNLVSEVMVIADDGKPITATPLTDTFLAGWTPDGSALVC
jgi:WD40-like Beta Propeller Repeat